MKNEYLQGSLNPKLIRDNLRFQIEFARNHPDYFYPSGIMVFTGSQGEGKSLSAVQYIQKLTFAYPKAKLATNIEILGLNPLTEVIELEPLTLIQQLTDIENGEYGVIYFIEEMHLYFGSNDSRSLPIDLLAEISQQRKQRKHIIGTLQRFKKLALPLREQLHTAIICKNYFKLLQVNRLVYGDDSTESNGKVSAPTKGLYIWFHDPVLYSQYDTNKKFGKLSQAWKLNKKGGQSEWI